MSLVFSVSDILTATHWFYEYFRSCKKTYLHEGLYELQNLTKDLQAVETCLRTFLGVIENDQTTWIGGHVAQQAHYEALEQAVQECKTCDDAFVRSVMLHEERVSHQQGTTAQARNTVRQWLNSVEIREFKASIGAQALQLNILLDKFKRNAILGPRVDEIESKTEDLDVLPPPYVDEEYSAGWDRGDPNILKAQSTEKFPSHSRRKRVNDTRLSCTVNERPQWDVKSLVTHGSCLPCKHRNQGARMRSYVRHGASLVGLLSCWALSIFDCSSIPVNTLPSANLCAITHLPYISDSKVVSMPQTMILACIALATSTTLFHYLTLQDQHRRWIILAWALLAVPFGIRDSTPGHELVSVYVAWAVNFGMITSWVLHAWFRARDSPAVEHHTAVGGVMGRLLDTDATAANTMMGNQSRESEV